MTAARTAVFVLLASLVALGAVVVAAVPPAMAMPGDFVYTAVDVFGASTSSVLGINSVGELAGDYRDAQGTLRGYVMSGGVPSDVFWKGADATEAFSINTRGDVAGTFYDATGAHGFLLVDGTYSEVAIEGAADVYVYDINDSGAIVGEYADGDGVWFNFVRSASGTTTFTEADMIAQTGGNIAWVEANGFNDRGQVVGHMQRAGYHMTGFIYANGRFTEVDYPEANLMSCFFGISDAGQAVGHVRLSANGVVYGSIFKNGRFTALLRYRDAQGNLAPHTYLHAMSPNGLIGGYYMSGGKQHAFVARSLAD